MKNLRKGIFGIVRSNNETPTPAPQDSLDEWHKKDWFRQGRDRAATMNGSDAGLLTCLAVIFQEFRRLLHASERTKQGETRPQEIKLATEKAQIEAEEARLASFENQIEALRNKNDELDERIRAIRRNPEEEIHDGIGTSKAGYVIGIIILAFLTVYLFVFYSSASFSALFKTFTNDDIKLSAAIFDAQAITKAAQDGLTEMILILTIPFVFLALGYLIHKFQEDKTWVKWPKIGVMLLITFAFDAILAYEIVKKIAKLDAERNFEKFSYNIQAASQDPQFWMIIFAGFVVYVVWGFVFDFVMEAHEKLDKVASRIKLILTEMAANLKKTEILGKDASSSKEAIAKHRSSIRALETSIATTGTVYTYDTSLLKGPLNQFLQGWLSWLSFMDRPLEKDQANRVFEEFVKKNLDSN